MFLRHSVHTIHWDFPTPHSKWFAEHGEPHKEHTSLAMTPLVSAQSISYRVQNDEFVGLCPLIIARVFRVDIAHKIGILTASMINHVNSTPLRQRRYLAVARSINISTFAERHRFGRAVSGNVPLLIDSMQIMYRQRAHFCARAQRTINVLQQSAG